MPSIKISKIACAILLSALLSGCDKPELTKPVIEPCVELVDSSAFCKKTYVDTERDVPAEQWEKERKQRISIRLDDLENIFKVFNKVCEKEFKCEEEKEKLHKTYLILKQAVDQSRD